MGFFGRFKKNTVGLSDQDSGPVPGKYKGTFDTGAEVAKDRLDSQ